MNILKNKKFKPSWWGTVSTLLAIALMIGLGCWQLHRLEWKQQLLRQIQVNRQAPYIQNELLTPQDEYRKIKIEGRFLNGEEFLIPGQSKEGRVGYFVVVPFQTNKGYYILINRGWIPPNKKDPSQRSENLKTGKTMIQGIVRWPQEPSLLLKWIGIQNQPSRNLWLWINTQQMFDKLTIPASETLPWFLEVDLDPVQDFPVGGQTRVNIPNNHLQYALTWFSLASVLFIVYLISNTRSTNGA